MKKRMWTMVLAMTVAIGCGLPALAQRADEVRQALQMAVAEAQKAMASGGIPRGTPVSLLPVWNDQDEYVAGLLKNAVTAAGLTYVEGKEEAFWDEVLKEVEWDERKGDILDAGTLVKFGKLKATRILMYGSVREASLTGQRVFVEIELHASSVETKQHLWGGTFAKRFYLPGTVEGILSVDQLPPEVREVIKKGFIEKAAASLAKAEPKLKAVRTACLIPLAGDIDEYITGLGRDMLAQSRNLYPKNLDVTTLSEARVMLRDQPQRADALLYGAVRDVSRRLVKEWPLSKTYEVSTETQLFIESASSNEILWSDTVAARGEYTRDITIWTWMGEHPRAMMVAGGILVALILLTVVVRGASRVR